jgi:hypothetical protein
MKHLSEEAYHYMDQVWGFNRSHYADDMSMFWESGYPELTAYLLVDAGAVEPNCKEAREMIRVARSISQEEFTTITDEVTKKYTIVRCDYCDHLHYIPSSWCNPNDWLNGECEGCYKPGYMSVSA